MQMCYCCIHIAIFEVHKSKTSAVILMRHGLFYLEHIARFVISLTADSFYHEYTPARVTLPNC